MTYSKELHEVCRQFPNQVGEVSVIQLLDEIDRLNGFIDWQQMTIDRLTAANKWVSVKVALPDNDQKILFYSQDGDTIKGMYRDELWFFDTGWEYENSPVTHWQPLPTPPTGGE